MLFKPCTTSLKYCLCSRAHHNIFRTNRAARRLALHNPRQPSTALDRAPRLPFLPPDDFPVLVDLEANASCGCTVSSLVRYQHQHQHQHSSLSRQQQLSTTHTPRHRPHSLAWKHTDDISAAQPHTSPTLPSSPHYTLLPHIHTPYLPAALHHNGTNAASPSLETRPCFLRTHEDWLCCGCIYVFPSWWVLNSWG